MNLDLQNSSDTQTKKIKNYFLMAMALLVVSFVCLLFCLNRNRDLENQLKKQAQKINQQSQLLASTKKCNSIVLLNTIFDEIEAEISKDPKKVLSDKTIKKIIHLNASFEPYNITEKDSISSNRWSPERGQLLSRLGSMQLDTSSFNKIKRGTSFLGADLRDANLEAFDLSGIDLKKANLKGAQLNAANFENAIISDAKLWNANLQKANLKGCTLHRADLRWADLSEADLSKADLNGANLNDAKLNKSILQEVKLEWAKSRNTYLKGANFKKAKLTGTDLANANLTQTDFSLANMHLVNFSGTILNETNLSNAELSKATVLEKDWIHTLKSRKVIGAEQIDSIYKTIVEVSGKYNFRLVKK